ncbi:MAG: hypothetical protein ACPGQS_14365 [Bradymonadia bacterium]
MALLSEWWFYVLLFLGFILFARPIVKRMHDEIERTSASPFDAALSDWTQVDQLKGQYVKVCLIACAHPDQIAFDELGVDLTERSVSIPSGYESFLVDRYGNVIDWKKGGIEVESHAVKLAKRLKIPLERTV